MNNIRETSINKRIHIFYMHQHVCISFHPPPPLHTHTSSYTLLRPLGDGVHSLFPSVMPRPFFFQLRRTLTSHRPIFAHFIVDWNSFVFFLHWVDLHLVCAELNSTECFEMRWFLSRNNKLNLWHVLYAQCIEVAIFSKFKRLTLKAPRIVQIPEKTPNQVEIPD